MYSTSECQWNSSGPCRRLLLETIGRCPAWRRGSSENGSRSTGSWRDDRAFKPPFGSDKGSSVNLVKLGLHRISLAEHGAGVLRTARAGETVRLAHRNPTAATGRARDLIQ